MAKNKKKDKKKKQSASVGKQQLSTSAARAEKTAAKKKTTSTPAAVSPTSAFSKASQQKTQPKKQTAPAKTSTNTAATRRTTNVDSRINKQESQNATRRVAAGDNARKKGEKSYNQQNGSVTQRIADANNMLNQSKKKFDKAGTYGKAVWRQKKTETFNKAKDHVSDKGGRDMIKNGGFTKSQQKELDTIRLNNYDTSATLDLDKSSLKTKSKKPKESGHTETKYDKEKDLTRRATAERLYGKNISEEHKRLKNFNTKDTQFRAANKTAEASAKAFEDAYARMQENPSAENVAAAQAARDKAQADVDAARAAGSAAQDAWTFYQHEVRFGKGNIDLTDLPKKANGKTTAYFSGDSKLDTKVRGSGNAFLHYDEKEKKYVLIPNYVKRDGEWQQLNSEEAIANYENSDRYFGKFDTEDEAWNYVDEMTKKQGELVDNNYTKELSQYNDLKNAQSKAKAAFKLANQSYQTLQTSGANEEQLAKAKQAVADTRAAYEEASEAKSKYKDDHQDLKASWGVVSSTIQQGITTVSSGIDDTLAMFANLVDKDDDNFFSRRAEQTRKTLEAQARTSRASTGTSKAAQTAQSYAVEAVAAIPDLIVALATGPEGALAKAGARAAGVTLGSEAGKAVTRKALTRTAFEGMGSAGKAETVLRTLVDSSKDIVTNPNFATSFSRMAGSSYNAAIEGGATEKEAFSQGILNGMLGSMLEIGEVGGEGIFGGIQKVGAYKKLLAKGDMKAANKFIKDSVFGEGMEEVAQGIVERLLQTTTYGADNPVFSTTDQNAIINPVTAAQEFAGGAVVGGLLGGGTAAVNAATQPLRDARTGRASTDARIDIIKEGMKYAPDSKSYKLAKELDEKMSKAFTNAGTETTVETMTGQEARGIQFDETNANNVDNLSSVVSDRELGKLMRQMAKDRIVYSPEAIANETETEHDGSQNARMLADAAKKIDSNGDKVAVNEKDAIVLDEAIRRIIDEGEGAVSQTELKEALRNKFDFNDVGFRGAINQILGEEVLTDNNMTLVQVTDLIRNKAISMHEAINEAADIVADQNELELADEEEATDMAEDIAEQAQSEAVNEAYDPEAARQAEQEQLRAQRRSELDTLLAPLAEGYGDSRIEVPSVDGTYEVELVPSEDGETVEYRITQDGTEVFATDDLEDVKDYLADTEATAEVEEPLSPMEELAQRTEQNLRDQREEEEYAERNAQLIEQMADAKEKEGKADAAKALRDEADEVRQRSKLHDNVERLWVGGKLYTRDEFYDLYQKKANTGGKQITRQESDDYFDFLQKRNEDVSREARMSLTGDYVNTNATIEFDEGAPLNETQIVMGNYVAATAGKVDRIIYCSNETMRGANASILNGELRINADTMTTQRAMEFVLGHEFLHGASEKIAHATGEVLDSKAGDRLTDETINALQSTVRRLHDRYPDDRNINALYKKYVEDFEAEKIGRYNLYSEFMIRAEVEKLARKSGDHLLVTLSTRTNQTEDGIRRYLGGEGSVFDETEIKELVDKIAEMREQVRPDVENLLNPSDRPYAYIRQEIAADWIGELAGQQQLLNRMAKDNHGMVYKLYQSSEKMRRRMAGMSVPTAAGYVNIANKEFAKTVEEITDKLVQAMDEGHKAEINRVTHSNTATYGEQIAAGQRMRLAKSQMNDMQRAAYYRAQTMLETAKTPAEENKARKIIERIEMEILQDNDYQRQYRESMNGTPREDGREGTIIEINEPKSLYGQKKQWSRQTHNILGENYDWGEGEDTGISPWNHLYMYSTPGEALSQIGVVQDTPMSMPIASAITAATNRVVSINHSEAHNLGEAAIANAPENIENACFIANGKHSTDKQLSGKSTVVITSSEIDQNTGGVITYVMMPSVDAVANFAGMGNMPANVILSAYARQNVFGELTQYDRQIDEEIRAVKANPSLSEEQKEKEIRELSEYKAANRFRNMLKDRNDPFARSNVGTLNLKSSDPNSQETGYAAEAVRTENSLYSDETKMRETLDKINTYWHDVLYKQWKAEARANHTRVPPEPRPFVLPEDTLLYGDVPGTGQHKRPNGTTRESQAGLYAGYFSVREGTGYSGTNPPAPRMQLSKKALDKYNEEVQKHPFVATHRLDAKWATEALRSGKILGPSFAATTPEIGIARGDIYGDVVFMLNRSAVDPAMNPLSWLFADDTYTPMKDEMGTKVHIMTDEDLSIFGNDMAALANKFGQRTWGDGQSYIEGLDGYSILESLDVEDAIKNKSGRPEDDYPLFRPRTWHDYIKGTPDDFAANALKSKGENLDFFIEAYLADMGYHSAKGTDTYQLLAQVEKEAASSHGKMPGFETWLAQQYFGHLSAVGRMRRDIPLDMMAPDMFPDDPVASFYAEMAPITEEGEVRELFRNGVRNAVGQWDYQWFDAASRIRAEGTKEYSSVDEAREDYEKIRWDSADHESSDLAMERLARDIRHGIQMDMERVEMEREMAEAEEDYEEDEYDDYEDLDFSMFDETLMEDESWGEMPEEEDEETDSPWEDLPEAAWPGQYFVDIMKNADLTDADSIREFSEEMKYPLSDDTISKFLLLKEYVDTAPVQYFEGKIEGYLDVASAVGYIIIPSNASVELRQAVEDSGIPYAVAEADNIDDYQQKVEEAQDMRFSLPNRTGNELVDSRLSLLRRRENRLRAQQSQNLSERARQATEDELAEVRNTADALATGQQTADVIEGPGTGQIVNIPNPRTSSIDDIFSVILEAPIERGTSGEIIESLYRTAGYNPNRSVRPSSIKQSRVNENTFSGMPFFRRIMKGMTDENERRQAAATLNDVKNAGLYDTVTEGQSMREASRRLETDYAGERKRLYTSTDEMGATDLDVAMGILAREFAEGKSDQFMETARIIQEKATTAGQFIQAFAKYSRSPEGVLVDAMNDFKRAKLSPEKQAELLDAMRDLAETLHAMQEGDMDGIIEVIKRQAKIRKTPISEFTIKSLKQADWQTNYDRAIAQLRMIPRDYVRATVGEKLSTYQVLSHLLNFRTFGRNAVANLVFTDIDSLLGNNMAWLADKALAAMTGQRSVGGQGGFLTSRNTLSGAVYGMRQEAANVSLDIDPYGHATKYGNSKRTWHKAGSTPGGSMMSSLEKMLGYELNVMDELSKGGIRAQVMKSLQPLLDNGTITQEVANQVAQEEMEYRTFQDDTKVGKTLGLVHDVGNMLIGFGDSGKKIGGFEVHAFGLGDFIQKYTTVPGALITRAYEYSPFGYLKAISNMKTFAEARKILEEESGKTLVNPKKLQAAQNDLFFAQRHAAMSLGRASTGTGIILAFALMTGLGLLNDEDEGKDTKEKNYETLRGLQGISGTQLNWSALTRLITSGDVKEAEWQNEDTLIDVSFLEPMNSLMSTGALIAGQRDFQEIIDTYRHPTLSGIGDEATNVGKSSLLGMWFALSDLPTMQSLSSLQTALQYFDEASDIPKPLYVGMEVMKGSATGFVPSLVRQTAQAFDPYYRDAYTSKDQVQQLQDAMRNSIPEITDELDWGRGSLQTKLTPFGQDKEAEPLRRRVLNAFLNPGKASTYRTDEVYSALSEAYATTGNDSIFPKRNAPYKLDFGTMDELNDDQRRMYQTVYGNQIQSDLSELVQSSGYKNANAETRAQMVADTKSFSEKVAKMQIAERLGVEYGDAGEVQTILDAKNVGFSLADWTTMKAEVHALPSDVNAKGNTISGSKKKKVIAYIDNFRWPDGKPLTNAQKRQLYYHHGDNYKAGSSPWEED